MISEKVSQLFKGRKTADSDRRTARMAGVLIITGMVAGVLSVVPAVDSTDYLVRAFAYENQVRMGAFFQLIMIVAYVGVPVLLYPILSKYNRAMAIGAVSSSIIAGMLIVLGGMILILLLTLSHEFILMGDHELIFFQTLGELLQTGRDFVNHVAMTSAFCTSWLLINCVFYQTKLVPDLLSVLGMIGAVMSITASLFFMFGSIGLDGVYIVMNVPIAIQEIVLAIYLIFKGFRLSVQDSIMKE